MFLFPPELVGIAKKIALLSGDAARIINGLLHLPLDLMRAIAVLDAPAFILRPITSLLLPVYQTLLTVRGVSEPSPLCAEDMKLVIDRLQNNINETKVNVYEREIPDATSRNFCRNFMIFSGAENRHKRREMNRSLN